MKKIFPSLGWLLLGLVLRAHGQSVAWNDPGPVVPNSVIQLELVFMDCQPQGGVAIPKANGLQVLGQPGRATSLSIINFQTSSSTTLSFSVQVNQGGRLQIPPFEVETDKGKKTVPALSLDATATAQAPAAPAPFPFPPGFFQNQPPPGSAPVVPPSAVRAEADAAPRNPFVGEVFDVNYRVTMGPGRTGRVKTTPNWEVSNFTAEAWDRGQQIGPGGSQGLQFHTRAMMPKAGKRELPTIRQKLDIDTPLGGRSFFFTAPGSVEVEASTDPVSLEVQPLPAGAPAGFKGAVGQFTLESKMVPEQVNEGEPITWTLSLRGTGNWPMGVELPPRTVHAKMRTIQPKLRREFDGTQVFTGGLVEDLVLISTEAGEYELPAVRFVYFDPKKRSYETIEAKPPKISVVKEGTLRPAGPAQVTIGPAGATGQRQGSGPGWAGIGSGRQAKVLQYGMPALPREPLEGTGLGLGPWPHGLVILLAILPWGFLLWRWWGWIQQRAILNDPDRVRKEALSALMGCVNRIENAKKIEDLRSPLILWQQAVFRFLGIPTAAPRADEIKKVKPGLVSAEDLTVLYQSYKTVEDALYGKNTGVKIGVWCDQVRAIAAKVQFPRPRMARVLSPQNIWPWITLLIFCTWTALAGDPPSPSSGDPIGLYREGKFAEAGKIWGDAVRKNLTDPVSRNNLALAWFQLGDKERALANGLSAYLVSPRTGTVGWNMMIFADAADQLDPAVRSLLGDSWGSWLASKAGVFAWQAGMVAGHAVAACAAGLLLASGYFQRFRRVLFTLGITMLLVGLAGIGASMMALGVYGKLSDRAAVMIVDVVPLRSVPTEVQQTEKAYPPGSMAHREKEFLGWSKVWMPNGDAGWIRTENLVPLY